MNPRANCLVTASLLLLSGCASTATPARSGPGTATVAGSGADTPATAPAGALTPGRGLFASYARERLPTEGFPNPHTVEYFSEEWGVLYDAQGQPYGPNSLYVLDRQVGNPRLTVSDSTISNGRIRIARNAAAVEPVFGHFLELMDLALHDLSGALRVAPAGLIEADFAVDLDAYRARWGREYWLTHVVDAKAAPQIVFEPVDVLFARKIAPFAAHNAVAQLLLQQKCGDALPPWLYFGLSSYLAAEGNMLVSFVNEFRERRPVLLAPEQTNQHLRPLVDREQGRVALYNAFLMAWHLCESWGFERVRTLLDALGQGASLDDAAQAAYGREWPEVTAMVDPRVAGEPQGASFGMRSQAPNGAPTPAPPVPHRHEPAPSGGGGPRERP